MGKAIEDIAGCEVFLKAVETLKATKRLRVIENDHEGQQTTSLGFVSWLRYFRENVKSSFQIQGRIDTTSPYSSEFKFNPFWHIQICTHIWAWLNECKLKNVNGVGGGVEGQGHGSGGRLLSHWGEWLSNCGLTHPPVNPTNLPTEQKKTLHSWSVGTLREPFYWPNCWVGWWAWVVLEYLIFQILTYLSSFRIRMYFVEAVSVS